MKIEEFKNVLLQAAVTDVSRQILTQNTNWYFDECSEIDRAVDYRSFREIVADHIDLRPEQIALVGSTVYGYSLSPKREKTFSAFHDASDLDLVIISELLFRTVWHELLAAYHQGYRWIMDRHSDEIFRKFALLITNGNYKTKVLRQRVKTLDGISKQIYLKTGSSRPLKYRIYESQEAAIAYHASGLERIKRTLENDT